MKAYYYRRIDRDDAMFIGLAVASSLKELFWTIDEHDDPYGYEFAPAISGDALVIRVLDSSRQSAEEAGESGNWKPFDCVTTYCNDREDLDNPYRAEATESMRGELDRKWRTFGKNFNCV